MTTTPGPQVAATAVSSGAVVIPKRRRIDIWRKFKEEKLFAFGCTMVAIMLVLGSVVFFTLFELGGSALSQFSERSTQLPNDGFFTVTSGQTQSFNGAFILIFAPIFAMMWTWLGRHKKDPGDAFKLALEIAAAALLLGAALYALLLRAYPLVRPVSR